MNIQVSLHDGSVISTSNSEYNAVALAEMMNDPKILMVVVGNAVVNKNVVKLITPIATQE